MQALDLTTSHRGCEASTMTVSIQKKKKTDLVEPLRTIHSFQNREVQPQLIGFVAFSTYAGFGS